MRARYVRVRAHANAHVRVCGRVSSVCAQTCAETDAMAEILLGYLLCSLSNVDAKVDAIALTLFSAGMDAVTHSCNGNDETVTQQAMQVS